jgi:TetR/AcrR family transcriptional repressor of nem operon
MRYEPDHKQQTRQKVLQAAARAIRVEGPHRVAVAKVMARAGLTVGGFYAHFKSKDELIAAAIDEMFVEAKSRALLELDDRAPAAALGAYFDFYLSPTHRDARATGCPMPSLAADLPRLTEKARERFAAGVAGLRRSLAEQLIRLGRDDAAAEASSVIAELVGAVSLARAEPDPIASDAILANSNAALKRRLNLESRS